MATVASGLNSGSGFNSSDTITSTTLNNHVNNATVTAIANADVASNAALAFTKLADITNNNLVGRVDNANNANVPIVIGGSGDAGVLFDNDDMLDNSDTAGGSATRGATQQSIKAYLDTQIAAFPITAPTGTTVATCGTVTLPGGLILKFGQGSSTSDDNESFSFKSPNFASNCFAVLVTGIEHTVISKSVSGFTINRNDSVNGTVAFEFLAIGN